MSADCVMKTTCITNWHLTVLLEEARRCRLKAQSSDGEFVNQWLARAAALADVAEFMEEQIGKNSDD